MGDSLGARLRQARLAARISQEELAEKTGLSVRAISDLERGRTRKPYPRTVRLLMGALETGGHGTGAVPRQLPAGVRHFVGRAGEQRILTGLLDEAGAASGAVVISAVGGSAGIGKTALAVHWAHQVAERFPDGQLYVNLRGFDPAGTPLTPAAVVRRFLDALAVPAAHVPAAPDAQFDLYRSLLAGRRMLILLDNARDAGQVRPLLPGTGGCLVLVTSRDRLAGLVALDGALPLTLDLLSHKESRELLRRRLGPRRVAGEERAAGELIELCAHLPLALNIAAARAAVHPDVPLGTLAGELRDAGRRLDALSTGESASDVRAVFSWSYRTLSADAGYLFRLLGLHPGPDISPPAAASLAGVPVAVAAGLLAELARAHLVAEDGHGRYGLHDLLRAYAAEQAHADDTGVARQAAIRRMLDHYLVTAVDAAQLQDDNRLPTDTPPAAPGVAPERLATRSQALDWFTTEYRVLLGLVELAASGFEVHAWQLARALRSFFDYRAAWHDWDHTHRVAAQAAARLGDLRAQALTLISWARCQVYQDEWPEAHRHLRHALDLFRELDDPAGQARVLVNLGVAASGAGEYRQAIDWARRAHELYVELGERDGQAGSLSNIGLYHLRLGDHQEARALSTRALAVFTDLGNRHGQALAANTLGLAHRGLGGYRDAIASHTHAIRLVEELGDQAGLVEILANLAEAYRADGQPGPALDAYERALVICTELGHPRLTAMAERVGELRRES